MLLWALVCLAMNSSVLTYHLSLRPEKEIIFAFLLLANIHKSVIYDMSAALKLAQNNEEQKEQRGLGGGRRWEEKQHRPTSRIVLNFLLCAQPWVLDLINGMKNVCNSKNM